MVNTKQIARLIAGAVLPVVAIAVLGERPLLSQERQGCFIVDPVQGLIRLDDICPTPEPFLLPNAGADGLGTGDIQVTLRWATIDDLDLAVTGPDGERVYWDNPSPAVSGGRLDRDDNSECTTITNTPIENVFWPVSTAPDGQYLVEVELFARCAPGQAPIDFELSILTQGVTNMVQGTVDEVNPIFSYSFSLPVANAPTP